MSLNDDSRPTTPSQANTPTTPSPTQRADQICNRFFIKFLLILVASRSTAIENSPRSGRTDRWYNLETPDTDIHREHMRTYRTISAMSTPPTLTIHVVLTVPELANNRALVAVDGPESRLKIEPTPKAILLETWTLDAVAPSGSSSSLSSSESDQVSLAAVYKHAISLFRSLYTLCQQLPAAKLYQRYRQWSGVSASSQAFAMDLRLQLDTSILTFDASPSPSRPIPFGTAVHSFPSLPTPLGSLRIMVKYLTRPNFRIDTIESLISSRLFNQDANERLDESVTFTPTVQAHRAKDSAASSPGSGVAIRSSRPPVSVASRHSRTTSFPAVTGTTLNPRFQNEPNIPGSGSDRSSNPPIGVPGTSAGSSPAYTPYRGGEGPPFATPGSLGRATPLRSVREGEDAQVSGERLAFPGSADRPSPATSTSPSSNLSKLQPGSSPRSDGTRRPSVTPISAFKSSTIGSSGLNSPSTSLRSIGLSRPPSSLPHTVQEAPEGPRAWPILASSPPSGGILSQATEPPPFAVSTSAPKSGISALAALHNEAAKAGESSSQATRKRFSSSFHRRAPSLGTTGSGGTNISTETPSKRISSARPGGSPLANVSDLLAERSRPPSTLLDPTEKEQNISEFLRAIDNAKPLRSGLQDSHSSGSASSSAIGHTRRISLAERRQSPLIGKLDLPPPSPRSPPARVRELNWREEIEARDAEVAAAAERERADVQAPSDKGKENLSEKLDDMNTTFRRSVQGLKERSRRAAGRTSELASSAEEPQQQSNPVPGDSRRAGPSFRLETVRGRLPVSAPEYVATPDSTASDGSGFAGMVGKLDFDSPDLRSTFSRAQPQLRSGDPSPAADQRYADRRSHDIDSGQSQREEMEVPPSDEEAGRATKPERTSKYTSILRRDATVKPTDSRGSSGSAQSNDSSRTRRPATAWPGSSPQ